MYAWMGIQLGMPATYASHLFLFTFLSLSWLAKPSASLTIAAGPFGLLTIPTQLARPPFWRKQLAPCGLSRDDTGVRPSRCTNNVDFCFPDPYQPAFEVCTPCWKACLECTRYETPRRNGSGITNHECSSCGCSANSNSCTSSRSCRTGSYCDRYVGKCVSCYECVADEDVREGSCREICGHSPRPLLPSTFGLPYNPNDDGVASEWVIDAAIELALLFKQALGNAPAVGWYDVGQLLSQMGLNFMPPTQLQYAVLQLTRANSTYTGFVPARAPRAPPPREPNAPPSPPPPRPRSPSPSPRPPSPTPSPAPSPRPPSPWPPADPPLSPAPAPAALSPPLAPDAPTSSDTASTPPGRRRSSRRQRQLRRLAQAFDPTSDANPLTAPVYPEDFVRVFLVNQLQPYDVFCPSDASVFGNGVSYPGCACMAIPPEYQEDNTIVTGTTKQWVDYLALAAGGNASTANAVCPQGFRCSAANFAYMRHLMSRSYIPLVMGICVPCLVGEYCPQGTVEKSQELVEVCNRRSALLSGTGSDDGRSSADCGNTRLCPAGSYCPLPSVRQNCTNGDFCTEGSTEPVTCNFDTIINELPFATVKPQPTYVLSKVTSGSPLSGNYCPEGSVDPFNYCPEGYYCPQPGAKAICPTGHFCPAQSVAPQRCGFLLACNREGISKPEVAWWGFISFVVLLLLLPVAGVLYNLYEEKAMRRTAHMDKLLEALSAMGFGAGDEDDDSDSDSDSDTDDEYAELQGPGHKRRRRRWWGRLKDWFRRRVLHRIKSTVIQRSPSSQHNSAGGNSGKGIGVDIENLIQLGNNQLPPGFDKISPYLTIQFDQLVLKLKSGRRILDNVSGDFPHSHLHAIMGPSGSGKSSFITALIGKAGGGAISGSVVVWKCSSQEDELGQPCTFEEIRYLTGFVPQDDVVHATMTVRENLFYSAALRLPRGTPRQQRETAVRGALSMLGMAHVQHDVVGSVGRKGLSGGQRKRLNIGLELVAKPSLLMLDEPTSGLDAAVSHDVVLALKQMAEAGMNVMVVIHQPRYSIFEMFDSVLLLGVGGRTVFLGPVNLAEAYFNFLGFRPPPNENRADFYLDVISGAVWRENDEDFVPNELFTVWQEVGRMWLIEKLTNPEFFEDEEGEEGEEEDGEWAEEEGEEEHEELNEEDEEQMQREYEAQQAARANASMGRSITSVGLGFPHDHAHDHPHDVHHDVLSQYGVGGMGGKAGLRARSSGAGAYAERDDVNGTPRDSGYHHGASMDSIGDRGGFGETDSFQQPPQQQQQHTLQHSYHTPFRRDAMDSEGRSSSVIESPHAAPGFPPSPGAGMPHAMSSGSPGAGTALSPGSSQGLSPGPAAALHPMAAAAVPSHRSHLDQAHPRSRFAPDRMTTASSGSAVMRQSSGGVFGSGTTDASHMPVAYIVSSVSPRGALLPSQRSAPIVEVFEGQAGDDGGGGGSVSGSLQGVSSVPVAGRRRSNLGNGVSVPEDVPLLRGTLDDASGEHANSGGNVAAGSYGGGSPHILTKVTSMRAAFARATSLRGGPGTGGAADRGDRGTGTGTGDSSAGPSGVVDAEVPASRRFLEKVESLKEAGVSTLSAVGSMRAREVLRGAAGNASMGRRTFGQQGSSSRYVDVNEAAAAAIASVEAEQRLQQQQQQQQLGPLPEGVSVEGLAERTSGQRRSWASRISTARLLESAKQESMRGRARGNWGKVRTSIAGSNQEGAADAAADDMGGGSTVGDAPADTLHARAVTAEVLGGHLSAANSGPLSGSVRGGDMLSPKDTDGLPPAAAPAAGRTRWQGVSAGAVVRHGRSEGSSALASGPLPSGPLAIHLGSAPGRRRSGEGVASRTHSGVVTPRKGSAANVHSPNSPPSQQQQQQRGLPGVSKGSFWDAALTQLEKAHKEQRPGQAGDREIGKEKERPLSGPGIAPAPGEPQVKRGSVSQQPSKMSMADILKMARNVQHRATEGGRTTTPNPQRKTLTHVGVSRKTIGHTEQAGGAANPTSAGGAAAGAADRPAALHAQPGGDGGEGRRPALEPKKPTEPRQSTAMADLREQLAAKGKGGGKASMIDILRMAREAAKKDAEKDKERGEREAEEHHPTPPPPPAGRALLDAYRHSMRRSDTRREDRAAASPQGVPWPSAGSEAGMSGSGPLGKSAAAALLGQEVPMLEDNEDEVEEMVNRIYAEKPRLTHLSKVVPWRPKDLQAIHDNFDLLDVGGNKDVSYDEFLYFFSSLRKLLPERRFKKFVEMTIEQFNLQEESAVTRDEFLAGIKANLKESALPIELRRRRRRGYGYEQDHAAKKKRLAEVLRSIRKLKRAPEGRESEQGRSWSDYLASLRQRIRDKNISMTRKYRATRAARAVGASNPDVMARLKSVAQMYGVPVAGTGVPGSQHLMDGVGDGDVVMGGQTLLLSDAIAMSAAGALGTGFGVPASMGGPSPFMSPFATAGFFGMESDSGYGVTAGLAGPSYAAAGPPLAAAPTQGAGRRMKLLQTANGRSLLLPMSMTVDGQQSLGPIPTYNAPRAPRARHTSGPSLPSRMGNAGNAGVHSGDMDGGAATLGPARELELARVLGASPAPHAAGAGYGPSVSAAARVRRRDGDGHGSTAEFTSDGSRAARPSRRLQVVLTTGGRVSTDVSEHDINHVISGRINKSVTGRGPSVTAGGGRGPSVNSGGRRASMSAGGAGWRAPSASQSPRGGIDPQHVAAMAAAMHHGGSIIQVPAGRHGSVTAVGRHGSITAVGRMGSVTAGGRLGSITAGVTRVASTTARGAPGVAVIGGGRVGSITATGRISSITAAGPAARRRRRQSMMYRVGDASDVGTDVDDFGDTSGYGMAGARPGLLLPRADRGSVQNVLARLRAEKNTDPALLRQLEQQTSVAAPRGPGGSRHRFMSVMINPDNVELDGLLSPTALLPATPSVPFGYGAGGAFGGHPDGSALLSNAPSALPGGEYAAPLLQTRISRPGPGGLGPGKARHSSMVVFSSTGGDFTAPAPHSGAGAASGARSAGGHTAGSRSQASHTVRFAADGSAVPPSEQAMVMGAYTGLPGDPGPGNAGWGHAESGDVTGGGADHGDGGAPQFAMADEEEWINPCVLLSYYVMFYSEQAWLWLSLRVRHFVASLLGHERGGRALPSVGRQMYIVFRRSAAKFLNERAYALLDISLVIMLGLVMGAIQGHTSSLLKVPETCILVVLAFALTSLVTGLRTFGQEQLIYLTREAQAGLSVMSWMLGRIGWDAILQALYPAVYLGFYYAMTVFDTPFQLYYLVLFFVAWWGFGVGYLFSVLLESNNALLGGLSVTLIFGGIINGINPSVASTEGNLLLTGLQWMSYTRWAVEAVFIATSTPTPNSLVFLTAGAMSQLGFCGMHHELGSFEGGLDPQNLAAAFQPIFEQRYNTTLNTGNSTSSSSSSEGNSAAVSFLYRVYEDPGIVDGMCRTSFMYDILWLFIWGCVTRAAAFFVLLYKVERRMTTASVFG